MRALLSKRESECWHIRKGLKTLETHEYAYVKKTTEHMGSHVSATSVTLACVSFCSARVKQCAVATSLTWRAIVCTRAKRGAGLQLYVIYAAVDRDSVVKDRLCVKCHSSGISKRAVVQYIHAYRIFICRIL